MDSYGDNYILTGVETWKNTSKENEVAARLLCYKDKRFKIESCNVFLKIISWK